MSAERRFNQRRFLLEESLTQNGGARTVFVEHMTPGTTVPPHYHTRQYKPHPNTYIFRSVMLCFWFIFENAGYLQAGERHITTNNRNKTPGFAETFDLLEGSITVYSSAQAPKAGDDGADLDLLERSPKTLAPARAGEKETPTVAAGVYHKYVVGDVDTVLRVVVAPGHADFERLLMILNGLAEDGELESMSDSVLLMAVISEWSFLFFCPSVAF